MLSPQFVTKIASLLGALLAMAVFASAQSVVGTICNNTYALCTSAPCIPDPSDPDGRAICNCVVETGVNYGVATTCNDRAPVEVSGTTTLVSTYSFAQAAEKDVLTCAATKEAYWTDCLDVACTVDPRDPTLAICSCNLVKGGEFVTYGGGCDPATCDTAYWSAATVPAFNAGSDALMKFAGIDPSDPPYELCSPE